MSRIKNQTLRAAEDLIELRLKPGTRDCYLRLVVAGMDAAMHGGRDSLLMALRDSGHPIRDCAVVALDLCLRLRKRTDGDIPLLTAVAAARALMIHTLAFTELAGGRNIEATDLLGATHCFHELTFKRLHACNRPSQGAQPSGCLPQITAYMDKVERAVTAVVWLPLERGRPLTRPYLRSTPVISKGTY